MKKGSLLFPACAGVIPGRESIYTVAQTFPRMCGGDPSTFTPPEELNKLFPACAGVILFYIKRFRGVTHFSPHVRG